MAIWTLLAAALLASLRHAPAATRRWRPIHAALAAITVVGTVVHAWLIEGTMGTLSKAVLCALVLAATAKALMNLRARRSRQA